MSAGSADFRQWGPIDSTRWFICPTLTPLYYTRFYRELTPEQQLRYNQISAMSFNELLLFFETVLPRALQRTLKLPSMAHLRAPLAAFMEDEQRHREMWRELNRASKPEWYASRDQHIVRIRQPFPAALHLLASFPSKFPVVFWTILTLEEYSIEVARRCARMPPGTQEPHYAAAHRAHVADEVRHVALDRQLAAAFGEGLSAPWRRLNEWLFNFFLSSLWMKPRRAAMHMVDAFLREFPELQHRRAIIKEQLSELEHHPEYSAIMQRAARSGQAFSRCKKNHSHTTGQTAS